MMEVIIKTPPRIGINEFLADCGILYKCRQDTYRDAWLYMSPDEIVAGLKLKVGRIGAMLQVNSSKEKIADDLKDLVVYAYFLYAKVMEDE
jgi:hypothetical protein